MSPAPLPQKRPLYIALPIYRAPEHEFLTSFAKLSLAITARGIPCSIGKLPGESLITRGRNRLVAQFLKSGAESLLFLDDDLRFEPEDVLRLYDSGLDVVAAPYAAKSLEKRLVCNVSKDAPRRGDFVQGLDLPTGCLLIRRWVFEKLRDAVPLVVDDVPGDTFGKPYSCFFEDGPEDGGRADSRFLSEDYWFARLLQRAGIETWIDTLANLGHVGRWVFTAPSLAEQWAAEEKAG